MSRSEFTDWVSTSQEAVFPLEAGRYHLYVSYGDPFSHRVLLAIAFKCIPDDKLPIHCVLPVMGNIARPDEEPRRGWVFGDEEIEGIKCNDPLYNSHSVREFYDKTHACYKGLCSVPFLWDSKRQVIVNNDSAMLSEMMETVFAELGSNMDFRLRPTSKLQLINRLNEYIDTRLNRGVWKCAFAEEKEAERHKIFEALDYLDHRLSTSRFLCGKLPTEPDLRLFTTAIRFDPIYYDLFGCNTRHLADYPQLRNWLRDLYQWLSGCVSVPSTVKDLHSRLVYYANLYELNPSRQLPQLELSEPQPLSPTSNRLFMSQSPLSSPRDSPLSISPPLLTPPASPREQSKEFDLLAVHDRERLAAPQPETPTQAV